jgi:hypothetical protein
MSLYPPAPSCAAADLNDDQQVNAADVRILAQAFGSMVATPGSGADLDRDGRVTLRDMIRLRQFLGQTCGGSSPAAPAAIIEIAPIASPAARLVPSAIDAVLRERRDTVRVAAREKIAERPLWISATPRRPTRLICDRRGVRGSTTAMSGLDTTDRAAP